ncbi:NFATC2-interacting protein [Boleophthalmus pectinirostris]|uniref:NFATC2-interacting protein n=1 Tax=Boleophthalmus pectinirostris TaxID=150288 RepID=UPI00242B8A39|nr:NFATC2-interacting protein [Boleophthalmus pectinirostris]
MAETVKPPPKRRRILDPSAIVSVPIYSNQVSNSLQMKAPAFSDRESTGEKSKIHSTVFKAALPERQFPLKVRCRTDLHKIHVLPSTPLSAVVEQLSVKLGVPPPRLLLLREEAELSADATVGALGLGIADILECVVMAEAERDTPTGGDVDDVIKVRLQGKDRTMCQEFSVRRDAPLGSVFAQFSSGLAVVAQRKVSFHFDGCRLSSLQTPQELDMEDGDVIEVWT